LPEKVLTKFNRHHQSTLDTEIISKCFKHTLPT
jgi:hypothetical protein